MGLWKKTHKDRIIKNVAVMNSDVSNQEADHELEKEIKKKVRHTETKLGKDDVLDKQREEYWKERSDHWCRMQLGAQKGTGRHPVFAENWNIKCFRG